MTPSLLHRLLLVFLLLGAWSGAALGAEGGEIAELRRTLADVASQLESVENRSDSLRAAAERIALELAALEREENLGPVKRQQLSDYRQDAERLVTSRESLETERDRLERRYARTAERLLPLLGPAIDRAREAYQAEPPDSEARARLFREFEGMVAERSHLLSVLYEARPLIMLDVRMQRDDSTQDLRDKVDLLADNRDLLAAILGRLGSWKRELEDDRAVLEDYRKLREENEFFNTTDPVAPSHIGELPPGLGAEEVIPEELRALADRLDVPPGGLQTEEDYDRLLESVTRVDAMLEDEILAMDERQKIIEREIARREDAE